MVMTEKCRADGIQRGAQMLGASYTRGRCTTPELPGMTRTGPPVIADTSGVFFGRKQGGTVELFASPLNLCQGWSVFSFCPQF